MASLAQNVGVAGKLQVDGEFQAKVQNTVLEATATRACTATDHGKLILLSYAGAVAVTLPPNGATAGAIVDFMIIGTNSVAPTFTPATATTLRAFNDATAISCTYGSGHRIGAYVRFISDGTYWNVQNLSSANTLTVTS